ncbi:Hypp8740 [Branchiostoma lanceolatum]|uniref:Hypp8740 protein n=1 Tax=Branchiostoma lanceolatum TaxID=7740 RepID=A0A8J9Z8X3_BRALA|nr:Hypp8740 [Branchiostoma lanceolatum]
MVYLPSKCPPFKLLQSRKNSFEQELSLRKDENRDKSQSEQTRRHQPVKNKNAPEPDTTASQVAVPLTREHVAIQRNPFSTKDGRNTKAIPVVLVSAQVQAYDKLMLGDRSKDCLFSVTPSKVCAFVCPRKCSNKATSTSPPTGEWCLEQEALR